MNRTPGKYIKLVIYLIVILLINIAGMTLFFRIDLTRNGIYSLSDISQRVGSTLSEPLTIKVFFTKNLPAPYNNIERYLHDLLEEYSIDANQNFNYQFYDVSPEDDGLYSETQGNRGMALNYGITPVQIQIVEKDELKFKKAYMGLVIIHGDLIEKIQTITSTDGLEYKLTTTIQKLNNKISALSLLQEKIKIKLFLSSSLYEVAPHMGLSDLPGFNAQVESMVKKLNKKNYDKLEFIKLDPMGDTQLEDAVKHYQILNLQWPDIAKAGIKAGAGAIGLVMEYNGKAAQIPLLQVLQIPMIGIRYQLFDLKSIEESIDENVGTMIGINEDIGYMTDHDTLQIYGDTPSGPMGTQGKSELSNFRNLLSQNYSIRDVNLNYENIPENINCLIIAHPKKEFTDYELFQIDQFLMKGKNLALFLDPFKEVMPGGQNNMRFGANPQFVELDTGLEKLLDHYGVGLGKSYVLDKTCFKQKVPAQFGGGEKPIYFAPVIENKFINNDLDFMRNINELITLKVAPVEIDLEKINKNGLNAVKLISSSENSWEMSERISLNPMLLPSPPPASDMQSFPLAYLIKGRFPSYFAGKPEPVRVMDKKDAEKYKSKKDQGKNQAEIKRQGEFLEKGRAGKIFIIGSSEILKNTLLDEAGKGREGIFIMNVIDYLNNHVDIALLRSKEQRLNPLQNDIGQGVKTFVKTINIAGLPLLVVLFGIIILLRRVARKKKISIIFNK
ncbi:MAG: Gldg family protein [Deltaproteobacteria bacterium]|nr:Gldg family protein [Deltaproteobacteria bacterium]